MSDITCCICLSDKPVLPISLLCGHKYCYLCIKGFKMAKYGANCPLCREPISDDILNKLSLDDCIELDDEKPDYQWLYKGNRNGWWKYDLEHNKELETSYQQYLVDKTKMHVTNDGITPDASVDSSDDSSDDGVPVVTGKYMIIIGTKRFKLDFDSMHQTNDTGYGRDIVRIKTDEISQFHGLVKGIAGLSTKKN